jgi:uncharacterized protein
VISKIKLTSKQLIIGFIFATSIAISATTGADSLITIGTGSVTGVYYPVGGAICRLVNKGRKQHGIRCAVESTEGSVYNINSIRSGDLDMGLSQSDWQYHAYYGSSKFRDSGPFKDLRSVFSVHPESFTVVARADAHIRNLQDLKGKRVNIGNPGSGQRGTMEVLMDALGWTKSTFAQVSELTAAEQSSALCNNSIDAMVYIVGHPSGSIMEATTTCDTVLVNITGDVVDKLVQDNDFYRKAIIPGGMYRENPADTQTFGVGATVVTSTALSSDTVYQVVKSVFENLDEFKSLHPDFSSLKKSEMVKDSLTAPLHDGAIRYYKEAGLM